MAAEARERALEFEERNRDLEERQRKKTERVEAEFANDARQREIAAQRKAESEHYKSVNRRLASSWL
jgi:hypothetical protein